MTIVEANDLWGKKNRGGIPIKLVFAKIDPDYVSGRPRIVIEGESTLTSPKLRVSTYTPVPDEKVIVINDVIIGKII